MTPRTRIIAEVGLAHDGSLALASDYIKACAAAGADVVKFQMHLPQESSSWEPFRANASTRFDTSRLAYWERTGFNSDQWLALRSECATQAVGFMASTFSPEAVELGRKIGQCFWKVPSGQVGNVPMLLALAATEQPVYLSTGLANMPELERAIRILHQNELTLLHCSTIYPTPPEQWRLGHIERLARTWGKPVGYSDHSGTVTAGLAAAARYNLAALEVHVTFSKQFVTPDTPASLTMDDFRRLVEGVRAIEASRSPEKVDEQLLGSARGAYMPSLVAKVAIPKGTVVQLTHLVYRKIGQGPGMDWEQVVGRTAARNITEGSLFHAHDFEDTCEKSA